MKTIAFCMALFCHPSTITAAVTSGLVGEWLFNGDTLDSSGSGFHGVASSTSMTSDRLNQPGNALHFNGGAWVEVQDDPQLRPSTSWTISAWVRPETMTSPYNERIIDKGGDDYSGIAGYSLMYDTERRFLFGNTWGGGGQGGIISLTQVNSSEWYFLVGTYDGTNARLYVNGQLEASAPMSWTIDSTKPVQIGRFEGSINSPHWTSPFFGAIDDVRIYNRAIDDSEVTTLYLIPEPTTALLGLVALPLLCLRRRATSNHQI